MELREGVLARGSCDPIPFSVFFSTAHVRDMSTIVLLKNIDIPGFFTSAEDRNSSVFIRRLYWFILCTNSIYVSLTVVVVVDGFLSENFGFLPPPPPMQTWLEKALGRLSILQVTFDARNDEME